MVLFCHGLPGRMFVALAWLPLGTWSLWAAPTGKDMLTIATIINQSRFQHFTSDIMACFNYFGKNKSNLGSVLAAEENFGKTGSNN